MDRGHLTWAIAQGVVAVGMATTIFYTVTGFLWWLAFNFVAGLCGLAAAGMVQNIRRSAILCAIATGLYMPMNTYAGISNFASGSFHWVPVTFFSIGMAQAGLAFLVWRWTRPWNTTATRSQEPT